MAKRKKKKVSHGARRSPTRSNSRKKTPARTASRKASSARRAPAKVTQTQAQAPPKPGSFVWHELMTRDTSRAKNFYSKLFGWKMQDDEMMPGFIYTMISNKGDMLGGMMAITPEQGDTPPHWMIYISVRDVDATAAQCEAAGGEIIVPAHDIPVGRWALLQDPTGAKFAIYKGRKK